LNLGVPIDRERVEATFKDGVLTVRLPKAERVRPRKVEIKVE
jgi:HSP20 family protein